MGRRDHPSRGGKRRTVLQLNDTGSSYLARYGYSRNEDNNRVENNTAGTNPLANLVGQYSSSSEGEDEDNMPASSSKAKEVPPATSSTDARSPKPSLPSSIPLPPEPPASTAKPGPQAPSEGDKDIDYEVANFLAEIESLSTEVPDSASEAEARHLAPTPPVLDREASPKPVKEEPMVNRDGRGLGYPTDPRDGSDAPPRKSAASSNAYRMFVKGESEFTNKDATITKNNSKTVIKADSDRGQEEEDEDIPDAPATVWQQCLDENTQYYYYWNTVTNEVTWEIPAEYTQYLLLYKEYEERMARIPEERKQRKQQRDAEKAKSKTSSSKDKSQGSEAQGDDSRPGSSKEEATVGPHLPPSRGVPHCAPKGLPQNSASTSTGSPKDGGGSPGQTIGPALPPSSSEASVEGSDSVQESELALQELERTFLESAKLKMKRRRQEKSKADSSSADTAAAMSPSRAELPGASDSVSQSSAGEEQRSSKAGDDEEEDMEFDEEDIDRALELALERKKAELREMEEQEEKESSGKHVVDYHHHSQGSDPSLPASDSLPASTSNQEASSPPPSQPPASQPPASEAPASHVEANHKRPLVEADSASRDSLDAEAPPAKVPRLSLVAYHDDDDEVSGNEGEASQPAMEVETKPDVSSSTSGVGEATEKVETKTESQILVTELVDILYGKLEFLEFPTKNLSKLDRLLVELETRFADWKGGHLDTDHFLGCLAEANGLLRQYEAGAAPDGWSCHWDRDFRRYYYTNLATGASQWDFPKEEEDAPGSAGDSVSSSTAHAKGKGPGKGRPPSPKASTSSSSQESVSDSSASSGKSGKSDSSLKEAKPPSPLVSVYPGEPPPPGTVPAYAGLLPPPPPPPEPTPGDGDEYACDSNEDIDGVQMSPGLLSVDMESENEADSTQTSELQPGNVVIAKPPQLNLPAVSSSSSAVSSISTASTSVTPTPTPSSLPSGSSLIAPDTTLPPLPESGEAGQAECPPTLPSSSSGSVATNGASASEGEKKEKKKRKDKITSSSLSLKKKNVSSLVQKWNQVRQEVEKEQKVQEDRQRDIQMKLEEWKK